MADPDRPPAAPPGPAPAAPSPYADRRKNHALRELIDEMLASIRAATNQELWTPDERAQYESELSTIMTRVRAQAIEGKNEAAVRRAKGAEAPGAPAGGTPGPSRGAT